MIDTFPRERTRKVSPKLSFLRRKQPKVTDLSSQCPPLSLADNEQIVTCQPSSVNQLQDTQCPCPWTTTATFCDEYVVKWNIVTDYYRTRQATLSYLSPPPPPPDTINQKVFVVHSQSNRFIMASHLDDSAQPVTSPVFATDKEQHYYYQGNSKQCCCLCPTATLDGLVSLVHSDLFDSSSSPAAKAPHHTRLRHR